MLADTLDIPEIQVIVHYPNDPEFIWHHRILLKRVSGAVWIARTPDLDNTRHDLAIQEHVVLDRNATFPQHLRHHVYAHGFISRSALNNYKRRAGTQAAVLGDSMDTEVEELVWVIAMASRSSFGNVISDDIMNDPAGAVTLDTRGVALIEGEQVFVERILRSEIDNFRQTVRKDMVDLRLLGSHTDAAGKRKLPLSDVVALMKEPDFDDFPLGGIRAAKEYHSAVSEGAGNFTSYRSEWTRLSGVSEQSAVSHVHCNICEVLRLLLFYDQIDVSATAGGEMLTRWFIQSGISVERNPRHPDYSGLDIVISAPTTREGRAQTPNFNAWVTDRLKDRAAIWKQERFYREERNKLGAGDGAGGGGGGRGGHDNGGNSGRRNDNGGGDKFDAKKKKKVRPGGADNGGDGAASAPAAGS